jgi:hypothetical protein
MTYRPSETVFPPPFSARLPSFIYLGIAVAVVAVVALAHAQTDSSLHAWIVERDPRRLIGSRTFATLVVLSALASVARASMRGVRIRPDGIEYRDVLTLGWPRIKRYRWAQIDRIVLDPQHSIILDLWDGTRALLPEVGNRPALAAALEKVAHARAIPVRGGAGLDELPDSQDVEDADAPF